MFATTDYADMRTSFSGNQTSPMNLSSRAVETFAESTALVVTRVVVQKVLTPAVVIFGLVGNTVNVAVLTRPSMKSSTNRYLTALAVYDMLYLILVSALSLSHYETIASSYFYAWFNQLIVRPLTDTCSNTGVWLTLTFTVERYIGVCHPLKGKVWCTPRRAQIIISAVCLAAAAITFPEFFERTVVIKLDDVTNDDVIRFDVTRTEFGSSASYTFGYTYANQALFTFIPLVLLVFFNGLLIRQVVTSNKDRIKMTCVNEERQSRDQQRITVMLISVVIVFLLCQLPQSVQNLYRVYKTVTHSLTPSIRDILRITGNVFNLLVIINCSTNFVLYSSFSSKFRSTFAKIFFRQKINKTVSAETAATTNFY